MENKKWISVGEWKIENFDEVKLRADIMSDFCIESKDVRFSDTPDGKKLAEVFTELEKAEKVIWG